MGDVACHLALAEFIMRPQAELKSARLSVGNYAGERRGRQILKAEGEDRRNLLEAEKAQYCRSL